MKYTSFYKIEGGLRHKFVTDNKIKTDENNNIIFSEKTKQQRMVLEMMEFLLKVTKKHKIKWFAVCGTLLGAIRNKGIIPHDDDGDVGFVMSEYKKFKKLTKMNLHEQFEFIESECGFQLIQKEQYDYITHFDIFAFDDSPLDRDVLIYAGHIINNKPMFYASKCYPREYMNKKDIKHIVYRKFEHLMIPTPYEPTEYLSHLYSPNCLTTYVGDTRNMNGFHLHELFMSVISPHNRYKVYLKVVDFCAPFDKDKLNIETHLRLLVGRVLTVPTQMNNSIPKSIELIKDAFKKYIDANKNE